MVAAPAANQEIKGLSHQHKFVRISDSFVGHNCPVEEDSCLQHEKKNSDSWTNLQTPLTKANDLLLKGFK